MKKLAKLVVFLLCACLITSCFTACGASDKEKALAMLDGAWIDRDGDGYYFDTENMVYFEIENRVVQSSKSVEFEYARKEKREICVVYVFYYHDKTEFELADYFDKAYNPIVTVTTTPCHHDDSITR